MSKQNIKNIIESLGKDLFINPDHNGESIYYLDKDLKTPYTGILIESLGDITIWWSEYIDGVQNGIEKVFDENGHLEQISECKNNMHVGISKEYDEFGNLEYVGIKWNNGYVKQIFIDLDKKITKKVIDDNWINHFPISEDFYELLKLTDKELINYEFKPGNPNFIS